MEVPKDTTDVKEFKGADITPEGGLHPPDSKQLRLVMQPSLTRGEQ